MPTTSAITPKAAMRLLTLTTLLITGYNISGSGVFNSVALAAAPEPSPVIYQLACSNNKVRVAWSSSGYKIRPAQHCTVKKGDAVFISAAGNEAEAAQLVIRSSVPLTGFMLHAENLIGPTGRVFSAGNLDILRVAMVKTQKPTDKSTVVGQWPDPLPALNHPVKITPEMNQCFWIRVRCPKNIPAGQYKGYIRLSARGFTANIPVILRVYGFVLPDKMTCKTAFGFSPSLVWKYQHIRTLTQKRLVLDKYWRDFSTHHISPYDPGPLDNIRVKWPHVKPPASPYSNWENCNIVSNMVHDGKGALLVFDDDKKRDVVCKYKPFIKIPAKGFVLSFWYRSAMPDQRFMVTLDHYDKNKKWISGHNNDIAIKGNGKWEHYRHTIKDFPKGAAFVRLALRAARWTETGDQTGLVWFDDVSLKNAGTAAEYIKGGNFEQVKRTTPIVPADKLIPRLNFTSWDKAMARGLDYYHFNSFRLRIPGMGGGTYHSIRKPELLGFQETDPEYNIMFNSYCQQIQRHLANRGWLNEAFIYWFDEPSADQYGFVKHGFDKLKNACPKIDRLITEQPEPALYGGPNIYCVISYMYNEQRARQRQQAGDKMWWYICTGPKAPYCGEFIDHAGTELRVWLWQTWKRHISGILIWETNYWTSSAAYPNKLQNPYKDPMSWVSGYSTAAGIKRPWGNGDGRFIYPPMQAAGGAATGPILAGPVDSIRWEMLRDGIEDYEYLAILKRLIKTKASKLTAQQQKSFAELLLVPADISKDLTHFTKDPSTIERRRDKIARAIETLKKL